MKRFRFLPKLPRLIIGFAFCCSLLLLLRGFTHSNDLAFLYDLPKKDMVLHLEESISSSVSTSMDHTVSSNQWGLSGITAVGTLHLDQAQVCSVTAAPLFGDVKVLFLSADGTSLLWTTDDPADLSLPAGTHTVYCVGKHFWGSMRAETPSPFHPA